ncbi:hypothetical protein J3F83DRAFT_733959 [Trichoderma novae-zelandiae]
MLLRPAFSRNRLASSVSRGLHRRTMTSFTATPAKVPVHLPDGLSEDQLNSFKPFTVSRSSSPFSLRCLTTQC